MQDQRNHVRDDRDARVERAVVLLLLRDDGPESWSHADIEIELGPYSPLAVNDALARLEAEGVVEVSGEVAQASRATMRLDALKLICV